MLRCAMNNNAIILCSLFLLQSITALLFMPPSSTRETLCFGCSVFIIVPSGFCCCTKPKYAVCVCVCVFFVLPLIILVSGVVICNANFAFLLLAESWSVMPIGKESFCFMHQCVGTMYLILSWYTHDLIM